jgi:fucose 4-O-acetylase-like acetyltransferase
MIIKNKKDNKNINKKINLGIQLLRVILSFLIVILHCYDKSKIKSYLIKLTFRQLGYYVPTFFILSFYFSYNSFFLGNINRIIARFKRILIPYIIWPIIIWIKNILINYFYNNQAKLDIF